MPKDSLPAGFLWGAATASYQIEGAVDADGRGRSIWDTFSHQPGRVHGGDTGDVACDHYHRWPEDLDLLAGLGATAYRFSIGWPRIQPEGRGATNQPGLDFYSRLVDGLLERGITPCATLYHWDLPQALEDDGGWNTRDTAQRFADYAGLVAGALADRVPMWITLNEPAVHAYLGYALGQHAPGRTLGADVFPVVHHLLLGHGQAVRALRAAGAAAVGLTNNYQPVRPASRDQADRTAAEHFDAVYNAAFTDPVLLGRYPEPLGVTGESGESGEEAVRPGDLAAISAPLDFLGVNYYNPVRIGAAGAEGSEEAVVAGAGDFAVLPMDGVPRTSLGWPVVPDGLYELLTGLSGRYAGALPPLYVTENGACYDDVPDASGRVQDTERVAYLEGHIAAVRRAIAAGADVRGYFVWSLLDNFEWAEGYAKRFGIVSVDYETQRRTPKASYDFYRELIARGRQRA